MTYVATNSRPLNSLNFLTNTFGDNDDFQIDTSNVLREVVSLIKLAITTAYTTLPEEGISYTNGCPVYILSRVCNTSLETAHIIGECVKQFVNIRKVYTKLMPNELMLTTIGNCDLVNDSQSPLTRLELETLYQYLGSRRKIYVHMLLNCLFELSKQKYLVCLDYYHMKNDIVLPRIMSEENIITICKSSWLYMYLYTTIILL
jgi:hypothetical protein